jgi:hypothetical protein
MAIVLTPTTELEAVNTILSVIGEAPISSLQAGAAVADAVTAQQTLSEVNRSVQSKGWHFNTDKKISLSPEAFTGEVRVPSNCLRVDTVEDDKEVDVVLRGFRLYDRVNHTYSFTRSLMVDMVVLLPFEEIPETARHFITIKAARVFQARAVGAETLFSFSQLDERDALVAFKKAEGITGDYNILTGNPTVFRVLNRY